MPVFLLKRFATFVATLAVASMVVFAVLELLPGNAAELVLGDTATPESLAALEARLGLDQPPLARYAHWVVGLLSGERIGGLGEGHFGNNLATTRPIGAMFGGKCEV